MAGPGTRGASILFACALGLAANDAEASPEATDPSDPDGPSAAGDLTESEIGTEPDILATVSELATEGAAKFELADYLAAIELWEQAHAMLPDAAEFDPMRVQLQVLLAHGHIRAYELDDDPEHLHKADALLTSTLDQLDPNDQSSREQIEAHRERVNAELAELERERAELERLEVETKAREQALTEREAQLLAAQPQWSEQDEARARRHTKIGAIVLGTSVVPLAGMAVALGLGAHYERQGEAWVAQLEAEGQDLGLQSASGNAQNVRAGVITNQVAWAAGSVGAAMVISGATLVTVAALRRRRGRPIDLGQARLVPTLGGWAVQF